MKKISMLVAQAVISLIPFGYLYYLWNSLPERIPMHYNISFEVDRFGDKTELFWLIGFLTLITISVSALILFVGKIDPKGKFSETNPLLPKLS